MDIDGAGIAELFENFDLGDVIHVGHLSGGGESMESYGQWSTEMP